MDPRPVLGLRTVRSPFLDDLSPTEPREGQGSRRTPRLGGIATGSCMTALDLQNVDDDPDDGDDDEDDDEDSQDRGDREDAEDWEDDDDEEEDEDVETWQVSGDKPRRALVSS